MLGKNYYSHEQLDSFLVNYFRSISSGKISNGFDQTYVVDIRQKSLSFVKETRNNVPER